MTPEKCKEAFDLLASGQSILIEHPRLGKAEVSLLRIGTSGTLVVDWLCPKGEEPKPPSEEQNNSARKLVNAILAAGGIDIQGLPSEDFHSKEDREKFLFRMHGGGKG